LLKICDAFGASRFNIPKRNLIQNEINKIQAEISEKTNFLKQAKNSIKDYIRDKVGSVINKFINKYINKNININK
jgi:hypothetical protein